MIRAQFAIHTNGNEHTRRPIQVYDGQRVHLLQHALVFVFEYIRWFECIHHNHTVHAQNNNNNNEMVRLWSTQQCNVLCTKWINYQTVNLDVRIEIDAAAAAVAYIFWPIVYCVVPLSQHITNT